MIRCKVSIGSKEEYAGNDMVKVVASPVYGDPVYGKYTPCGSINLTMVKDAAAKLELGKQYYVDFTPVEEIKDIYAPKVESGYNGIAGCSDPLSCKDPSSKW